jgi:short-subunit dehydrogenase
LHEDKISKNVDFDLLINNAGIGYAGDMEHVPLEMWHRMFDVNVHGIFYCSRLVVPIMKAQGYGHIINISSIAGLNGIKRMAGYSATKHAVRGLSHSMYMELREFARERLF